MREGFLARQNRVLGWEEGVEGGTTGRSEDKAERERAWEVCYHDIQKVKEWPKKEWSSWGCSLFVKSVLSCVL